MAVGLPLKTTYANGDVYSASDVNDTNGTINLFQTSTLSVAAGKNSAINGGMDIWQRGTSIAGTTGSVYTADRWALNTGGNAGRTVSRQVTGDTTNLPSIQYCARIQRNSGQTNTAFARFYNMYETTNLIPLAGRTVTFSWYARKSSTFSGTQIIYSMQYGTGTDQNYFSGYTGSTSIVYASTVPTTTWVRYTTTQTIPATATELAIGFEVDWSGTAGANDYVEITGVQLEVGAYATTFSRAGGTMAGELLACQRYFEKSILQGSTPGANGNVGELWFPNASIANNETWQLVRFSVTKRTSPTVTTYSYAGTSGRAANDSGTDYGADSANVWRNGDSYAVIKNNSGSSMTVTSVRWIYCNWTASAEL